MVHPGGGVGVVDGQTGQIRMRHQQLRRLHGSLPVQGLDPDATFALISLINNIVINFFYINNNK